MMRVLIPLALAIPGGSASAAPPEFSVHVMGEWGSGLGHTSLVDIDRDGDLDFTVGTKNSAAAWWEYRGPDDWVRHDIGDGHGSSVGGVAHDVNGDGWTDFIAGGTWYANPADAEKARTQAWTRYGYGGTGAHDQRLGDVDGDGKLDVVSMEDNAKSIRWYRIPEKPETDRWPEAAFGKSVHSGLALGDLDGDGDLDVAGGGQQWYANDGTGQRWERHQLPYSGSASTASVAADLDGDDDLDLFLTDHDGSRVAWLENADGHGTAWREHTLSTNKDTLHSARVADLDDDGDPDLFAGDTYEDAYVWWNDGRGGFTETTIAKDVAIGHETRIGDVDGDGDLDIVGKPWRRDGRHTFLRNMLVENRGKSRD